MRLLCTEGEIPEVGLGHLTEVNISRSQGVNGAILSGGKVLGLCSVT